MVRFKALFMYFILLNLNIRLDALTCSYGTVSNVVSCDCKSEYFFCSSLHLLTQLTFNLVVRHISIQTSESYVGQVLLTFSHYISLAL